MELTVLTCILSIFSATYGSSGYVPLAPFLASSGQVGLLLSVQGFASFIALVPAGISVDNFGSQRVLMSGLVINLCGLLITALSCWFPIQLLGRILCGIASSVAFNAGMALIMHRFQDPQRSQRIGTAIGLGAMGNLVGPPAAGYIFSVTQASHWSKPQAWALLPAGLFSCLACITLKCDKGPKANPLLDTKVPQPQERTTASRPLSACCGVYMAVGKTSVILAAALICLFGSASALVVASALRLQTFGFSTAAIGMTSVPAALLQVLISPCAGRLATTPRRRVMLIASPLIALAGTLFTVACISMRSSGSVLLLIICSLSAGSFAAATADAPSMAMMADLAVAHGRGYGESVTASELAIRAGQSVGPTLSVLVLHLAGFGSLCLALAFIATVVAGACLVFLSSVDARQDECGDQPITTPSICLLSPAVPVLGEGAHIA